MTRPSLRLAAVALIGVAACHHAQPLNSPLPTAVPAPVTSAPAPVASPKSEPAIPTIVDSTAGTRSRDDATAREASLVQGTLAQPIYFAYDQDILSEEARGVLDQKVAVLAGHRSFTLTITGHTDERGTAEYNLALGQRRAAQVKRYLVSQGVDESRLTTVSAGDSQPASNGTDEASFARNRRAEFDTGRVSQ